MSIFNKIKTMLGGKPRFLTLKLNYPEEKELKFERLGNKIRISDSPDHTYQYLDNQVLTPAYKPGQVSQGAKIGVGIAAAVDGDLIKGAMIGDSLERFQDESVRRVAFIFENCETGEIRTIETRLTYQQIRTLERFFFM